MNNNEKRDRMLSVIADWEQSGKSKKAYCTEKGIKEGTFYYWFSLFKEKEVSSSNFISIDKPTKSNGIEVIYPNGVRIKVENDLGLLSQLIRLY